jgi:hypothetical protein
MTISASSQPRVFGLRGRIAGARPLRIVDHFRGELGVDDVAAPPVEGGGRADRFSRWPSRASFRPIHCGEALLGHPE